MLTKKGFLTSIIPRQKAQDMTPEEIYYELTRVNGNEHAYPTSEFQYTSTKFSWAIALLFYQLVFAKAAYAVKEVLFQDPDTQLNIFTDNFDIETKWFI